MLGKYEENDKEWEMNDFDEVKYYKTLLTRNKRKERRGQSLYSMQIILHIERNTVHSTDALQ